MNSEIVRCHSFDSCLNSRGEGVAFSLCETVPNRIRSEGLFRLEILFLSMTISDSEAWYDFKCGTVEDNCSTITTVFEILSGDTSHKEVPNE